MLFTGDAPATVEAELASSALDLRAQVLKVGHHGSRTSTSPEFLRHVQPQLAVISVGRRNVYGHPAPEVVARLEASGIDVRRTDREGTLLIKVSRDGLWRVHSAAEPFSAQTRVNLREE